MRPPPPQVGISNHDPVLIRRLKTVLRDAGFQTVQLTSGTTAYEEIKEQHPDLVILDTLLESPEVGWIVFQALRLDRETRDIAVLICSSEIERYEKRVEALETHGKVGVLNKPFDIETLVKRVQQMLAGKEIKTGEDGRRPRIRGREP